MTKTAHVMVELQEKFWQVAMSNLQMQQSSKPEAFFQKIESTHSQYTGVTNAYTLKCGEDFNLFSRFFCGKRWLNLPLPQKDAKTPKSWIDFLANRDQMSNLIASASSS